MSGAWSTEPLTAAERELLTYLAQECAEVVKEATKVLLYGWRPSVAGTGEAHDNRATLTQEIGDVMEVVKQLGFLDGTAMARAMDVKHARMRLFTRYQPYSTLRMKEPGGAAREPTAAMRDAAFILVPGATATDASELVAEVWRRMWDTREKLS